MNKVSTNCGLIQKSRYLENKTFFLQIKKIIYYTSKATLLQNIVSQWRSHLKNILRFKLEKSKAY